MPEASQDDTSCTRTHELQTGRSYVNYEHLEHPDRSSTIMPMFINVVLYLYSWTLQNSHISPMSSHSSVCDVVVNIVILHTDTGYVVIMSQNLFLLVDHDYQLWQTLYQNYIETGASPCIS